MKQIEIHTKLTKNELRALEIALNSAHHRCFTSCAYPEMQNKKTGCTECPYPKAIESLQQKFITKEGTDDETN